MALELNALFRPKGANLKSRDADGMTALRLAKVYGRVDVVDLLKRAGIELTRASSQILDT